MIGPHALLAVLAGATLVALAVACDGDADDAQSTPRTEATDSAVVTGSATATTSAVPPREGRTPPPAAARPTDFEIPEGRRDDILAAASDVERPLLEDGLLTFSEYERALFAGFACLEENGVGVFHRIPWVSDGTVISDVNERLPGARLTARGQYRYLTSSGSLSLIEFQGFQAKCAEENYAVVEFLWAENIGPSEEEAQEILRLTGDCMREAGFDVPVNPSDTDLMKAAYPPDGVNGPQHRNPDGSPVASALALLDCRLVTRFDLGYE